MAGLKSFDLASARGAGIANALNMQKFQQNALNGGGGDPTAPMRNYAERQRMIAAGATPEDIAIFDNYVRAMKIAELGGVDNIIGAGGISNTPLSTIESEVDAKKRLSGASEQGKADVQLKTKPKIESEIIKSKFEAEKETQKPKAITSAATERQKTTRLKTLIAKAKSQSTAWTTGFLGDKLKDVAGTPAYDLSQTLSTLQANAGFDRLQEMRDNSKTGGALGQVSERELGLLINAYQAITQSQSRKQLIENLDAFEKQLDQSWQRVNMAYELDYGEKYEGQAIEPQESTEENIINWEDM